MKKDEAVRSAMSRRLCRVRIRSSRRVNQVNAQRQRQSRLSVSVEYKNLGFSVWNVRDQDDIRLPRCLLVTQDPIYVVGSNGA